MSDCKTHKVRTKGYARIPTAQRKIGPGGGKPPTQTTSFDWCITHSQPHIICQEASDDQ